MVHRNDTPAIPPQNYEAKYLDNTSLDGRTVVNERNAQQSDQDRQIGGQRFEATDRAVPEPASTTGHARSPAPQTSHQYRMRHAVASTT